MSEMQEIGNWYEDVPYQECKSIIKERLTSMSRDFISVGYYLKYIRDKELYKEDGYASVWEFAESNYGIKMSTASRWMAMNDKFSQGGNTPLLDDRYRDFGKSQLQEMLYLTDDQMEQAKPDMPAKEIRAIRKPEKKSFEECAAYKCNGCCDNCYYKDRDDCPYDRTGYKVADWRIEHDRQTQEEHDRIREKEEKLSAYGTKKMVRPEDSLIDTEGCEGGHDCYSCSMDCKIRQKDRYCREAPLGKPFSCATMNVLDSLKQDIGDKCQFVNHELAYHRSGDHEPDPCCKECKEPCGYACPRAARKDTISVAPAQEVSESIDVLEFSVRVHNTLKRAGIDTVEQLLKMSDDELAKVRNFSKRCLDEVHSKLEAYKADAVSDQENIPEKEAQEVLHFTTAKEAYGAMIAELIGNYLDNAYTNPDRECEASVFGQTCKVLKRPEVTVFYTADGRTFFDVENVRLEQEYQWRQKNKPEPDKPEEVEGFVPAQQKEPEPAADCPPGISSCIRQEWGTDPDQQHEGAKECAKCWNAWKKTQKALQGESKPEQMDGEVMGFEVDEPVQEWPELLSDIPVFGELIVKDYLEHEEKDLIMFLGVDKEEELPLKVLQRKQMSVAGLRLLLELVGGIK